MLTNVYIQRETPNAHEDSDRIIKQQKEKVKLQAHIDYFRNRVGDDKDWLIILVSALVPFLLIVRLVRKYMKKVWEQQPFDLLFPIGLMWFTFLSNICLKHTNYPSPMHPTLQTICWR